MQNDQLDQLFKKAGFTKLESKLSIDFSFIEYFVKFDLPNDYKYYLSNYDIQEGFVGNEYLQFWDDKHILELNKQYHIDNLLGIGSNGSGEFIAITPEQEIILCPFIDMDRKNHIGIGSSFSEMLNRLLDGINWFE